MKNQSKTRLASTLIAGQNLINENESKTKRSTAQDRKGHTAPPPPKPECNGPRVM